MIDTMIAVLRKWMPHKLYGFLSLAVARAIGCPLTLGAIWRTRVRLMGSGQKPRIFLLDMATHSNIGDAALGVAQQRLIGQYYPEYVPIYAAEIRLSQSGTWGPRQWAKLYRKGDVLWLHGGGNLGNRYGYCDGTRRALIAAFGDAPKTTFPLSVSMLPGDAGAFIRDAAPAYGQARCLTLLLRDPISLRKVREFFPQADARLSPDIVLSMAQWYVTPPCKREGIYLCMRNDAERFYTQADIDGMIAELVSAGYQAQQGDMTCQRKITPRIRDGIVFATIGKHSRFQAVITDRLHGMVLSIVARTPCVVVRTGDQKLIGAYETVKAWPYVKFADNPREAVALAMQLAATDHAAIEPFAPDLSAIREKVAMSRKDAEGEGLL